MRRLLIPLVAVLGLVSLVAAKPSYLFVWAGDADGKASDFLAVIDATPSSAHYGEIVASIPTGVVGAHPHHTEAVLPANGHLLANGFHAGRTWLFDLTQPLHPRILTSFGDLAGYSHPHTYVRLADGNVLTTFQYRAMPGDMEMHHASGPMTMADPMEHSTGGLVEMSERGHVLRSGDASDAAISEKHIYPYAVLPMPSIDRAISTTTDMNEADTLATSEWVQFWRLSDLKLIKSVALKPGPRGNENRYTGEPRLLPDGKSVYIHTFNCGLYLLRDVNRPEPKADFVMSFEGTNCGVPILTGHYWLQTVPEAHALVAMDISDPMHPREVSRLAVGDDEGPHWVSIDPTGTRVVLNSSGGKGNRLYIINFDSKSGALAFDDKFRDPGSSRPGIYLTGKTWPHGFIGTVRPHGTVFSR
ncbi:MAG: hypothetical protein ABIQ55_06820 [Gemmatimonadaceae bacterium]